MTAIYDDIRQALEVKLNSISGLPSVAWENVQFDPEDNTSYVQPMFSPTNRQPAVRGLNPQQYYRGLFTVNVYTPADQGPSAADTLANTIIENFEATSDLTANSKTISIRTADRRMGMKVNNHYLVPVIIEWYCYA